MAARRRGTDTGKVSAPTGAEAASEPEIEPAAEPEIEPAAEPAIEPVAEPAVASAAGSPETEAQAQPVDAGSPAAPAAPAASDAVLDPPVTDTTDDGRSNGAHGDDALPEPVDMALPTVGPLPEVPDRGFFEAVRYALAVTRARWQRRAARKQLVAANERDEASLEQALMALGSKARALDVREPVLAQENHAIDHAETKRADIERACHEISSRQATEDSSFADSEVEHLAKIGELERERDAAQREIDDLEARRRGAQEKLDTVIRQQRGYIKVAEQRDDEAGRAAMGDARSGLRRAAEDLRRDAAALEEDKLAQERRLADIERPTSQALARREDIQARLDNARRQLQDARDSHRHRLAELDAEQNRRTRELSQADAEVNRHVATLGTLVNLHRFEHAELAPMYRRIDELRNAIGVRSTESDRLSADSEAYDHDSYRRGYLVLGAASLGILLLILILVVAL